MNRLFKYTTLLISLFITDLSGEAAVLVNTSVPDTLQISGNLQSVKSLISSREFSAAEMLAKEALNNSQKINYTSGLAWSKYYLGMICFENLVLDSAIYWIKQSEEDFSTIRNRKAQVKAANLLGVYYRYADSNDSSLDCHNRALKIAMENNDSAGIAESHYGIGMTLNQLGYYPETLEHFHTAISIRERLNDSSGIAAILNSMGILFRNQGDYANALDFYIRAFNIHEKLGNLQGLAYQHNNMGLIYRDIGDYGKALDHFNQSWALKVKINDTRGISNSIMNIGSVYLLQNKLDSALIYFDQAASIKEQIGDKSGIANINLFRGECYQKLGLFNKAISYLETSRSDYHALKEPRGETEAIIQLASTYFSTGLHDKAFQLMDEAQNMASALNMLDIKQKIYQNLYNFYIQLGDYRKGLEFYKLYIATRDSVMGTRNLRKMLNVELQDEYSRLIKQHFERKDQEMLVREKEQRSKTVMLYVLSGAFVILLLLMVMFIRTLKNKQKINSMLIAQQAEVEHQKQELMNQRNEIDTQKEMVVYQRDRIITMLTDLAESIDYAKKIQQAILPKESTLQQLFSDYFIIYQPKEAVGGDFYWVGKFNNTICFAVADCTGHGVPGGFMSMLGVSMINDMANAKSVQSPSWMLQSLRHNIVTALGQTSIDEDSHDGMDIAFCTFDTNSGILTYAGANIPIIISSKNEISPSDRILTHHDGLVELKPDRMPIALYDKMDSFSEIQVKLAPDDTVYLFTDGYVDQFGGQKNKKFGHEAFRALISSVKDLNFSEQKQIIWSTIERWKGETENQTDDILVMGLKLSQQIGKKV